jgi:hypothetical protein
MGDQRRKPHVEARQFLFQLRPIWMLLYKRSMMARLSLYDFNAPVRSPCSTCLPPSFSWDNASLRSRSFPPMASFAT